MSIARVIFDQDHEIFRASVRRFMTDTVAPQVERWREQGFVDREMYRQAGERGYLLMWAEERYGGAGIRDFRYEQILIEENMQRGDVGFFMTLHSRVVAPYIAALGNEPLKARLLPACVRGEAILGIAMTEAGAGSDLAGMRTRAERRGDHWVLNGSKTYISNGQIADQFVVAARTVAERKHGIGLFVVDARAAGFRRGRNLKKMGLKAQDTSELFFDDVQIPAGDVLGDPEKGFGYLAQFLVEERLIGACMYISHAQEAFDITLDFVKSRRVFGRPLGALQNTRFKMAEMRAQLDALQIFVDHCVLEHNAGRLSAATAAAAKLLASELEGRVLDECVQLHGGAGYMDEYRISRMYTDARISRIYAGSSEIMKEIISRDLGLDERNLT
jgi:alkylation response protein AidB-like acyl-CoA dehydrogenase